MLKEFWLALIILCMSWVALIDETMVSGITKPEKKSNIRKVVSTCTIPQMKLSSWFMMKYNKIPPRPVKIQASLLLRHISTRSTVSSISSSFMRSTLELSLRTFLDRPKGVSYTGVLPCIKEYSIHIRLYELQTYCNYCLSFSHTVLKYWYLETEVLIYIFYSSRIPHQVSSNSLQKTFYEQSKNIRN